MEMNSPYEVFLPRAIREYRESRWKNQANQQKLQPTGDKLLNLTPFPARNSESNEINSNGLHIPDEFAAWNGTHGAIAICKLNLA